MIRTRDLSNTTPRGRRRGVRAAAALALALAWPAGAGAGQRVITTGNLGVPTAGIARIFEGPVGDDPWTPGVSGGNTVGTLLTSSVNKVAFRLSTDGTFVRLRSPIANPGVATTGLDANRAGTSVGYAHDSPFTFQDGIPTRWARDGTGTRLNGLTPENRGRALRINDAGVAIGVSVDRARGIEAVRWDAGSVTATELEPLRVHPSGSTYTFAVAIAETGTIVGSSDKFAADGTRLGFRAVRWDAGTTAVTELRSPEVDATGGAHAVALAVNDIGTVVGFSRPGVGAGPAGHPIRWEANSTDAVVLGGIGTDAVGRAVGSPLAINADGTAVGYAVKFDDAHASLGRRAVRWDADAIDAVELEMPAPTSAASTLFSSQAHAINDAGFAVGVATERTDPTFGISIQRAMAWRPDGGAVVLNDLLDAGSGWDLTYALGIDEANWVSGYGTFDPDGPNGAAPLGKPFLIQLPEPATATTLLACVTLSARHRRRWTRAE